MGCPRLHAAAAGSYSAQAISPCAACASTLNLTSIATKRGRARPQLGAGILLAQFFEIMTIVQPQVLDYLNDFAVFFVFTH
jgi:hypothetical protein